MLGFGVKITDTATKYVKGKKRTASLAHSGAISTAGFELRRTIKSGMLEEAPGGERWPSTHPWTRYKLLQKSKKSFARAKKKGTKRRQIRRISIGGKPQPALKRLAAATRYKRSVTRGQDGTIATTLVKIGFITPKTAQLAEYHASGPHYVPVTPKMRRLIFASGLVISASKLRIPKRPHVEPVYKKNRRKIINFIESRIEAAVAGRNPRAIKPHFE